MKIAHIINIVEPRAGNPSYLNVAQPITLKSMAMAKRYARKKKCHVDLFSVQLKEEKQLSVPKEFTVLPALNKSVNDYGDFKPKVKNVPRIYDILKSLYDNSDADFFVYTNADIGVQRDFYIRLFKIIKNGYDSAVINRRDIPKKYNGSRLTAKNINLIYGLEGVKHPGKDCFLFRRNIFPKMNFKNVVIGVPPVGIVLMTQIRINSNNLKSITDGTKNKMTFHIGSDVEWRTKKISRLHRYNLSEAKGLWPRGKKK